MKRPKLLDDPKRELWLAWYATIGFYSLYTIVFFIVTRTQPPGKPWYDPTQVVAWFAGRHEGLLIGFALIFVLGGLSATSIALITYSIRRMSVSRAFSYSYLIIYAVSAVPGFLFICVAMTVGAMRPDRSPVIQRWLYDLGFLSFSGTMGVFLIGSLVWMTAILLDKNRVFPKWFAYPEPLQRPHGSRGRPFLDLSHRRLRLERGHRVVDKRRRLRPVHRCLHLPPQVFDPS